MNDLNLWLGAPSTIELWLIAIACGLSFSVAVYCTGLLIIDYRRELDDPEHDDVVADGIALIDKRVSPRRLGEVNYPTLGIPRLTGPALSAPVIPPTPSAAE